MERESRSTKARKRCGHPRDYRCACREDVTSHTEPRELDVTEYMARQQYPYRDLYDIES